MGTEEYRCLNTSYLIRIYRSILFTRRKGRSFFSRLLIDIFFVPRTGAIYIDIVSTFVMTQFQHFSRYESEKYSTGNKIII